MDIKKELMKFYVWQRNNCNVAEELKDIEEMVDIYITKREVNKTNDIHSVMPSYSEMMNLPLGKYLYLDEMKITRVVGGWIYNNRELNTSTFVPESEYYGN